MEDQSRDSQDSETNSEGSWILLSNEEAVADLSSVEVNTNCKINSLKEAVERLADADFKNYQSDIESDGISIISESEFSQSSESDDNDITAVISKSENYEDEKDILVKTRQFINVERKETEGEKVSKNFSRSSMDHKNECMKIENSSFYLKDKKISDLEATEELYATDKSIKKIHTENAAPQIVEETLKGEDSHNCLNSVIQKFEFKKMITLPSFLCTSVVIFAVLIFPFLSSKINDTNTLDQPDMEQYDENSLPANNIAVVDPLVYCMKIHKNENRYHDFNMKKCVKKVLKQMKKLKIHYNSVKFHPSGKEIDEKKKNNLNKNSDTLNIKERDFDYKDKKYKTIKKYNGFHKDGSKYHKESSEKISNIPVNEDVRASNVDVSVGEIESEHGYKFIHDLPNDNEKLSTQYWNSQQGEKKIEDHNQKKFETILEKEMFNKLRKELHEMKKSLLEKEKLLIEWEKQLIKRENKIMRKNNNKESKGEYNFVNKNKYRKIINRKGDFDEDGDLYERKFEKNKKQKKNDFIRTEKRKKHEELKNLERNNGLKFHEKFDEAGNEENWSKNEDILRMKGVFNNKNRRKILEKTVSPSEFAWENINKESSNKVNSNSDHNSKYWKMSNIGKKNRTRILDDDNITVTGEWYINLVQGRNDIRKKEEKAFWWFDRVDFRKNKRNKALWYFQYMVNRENLRYRQKNI